MSDGSLSQDEIDALLQGGGADFDASSVGDSGGAGGAQLSSEEIQAFKGLLDSFVGAQSSNLSGLLGGKSVTIQPPNVQAPTNEEAVQELPDEIVKVDLDYVEGLTGSHFYILANDAATTLAGLIVGQEQVDLNEMALESLKEALSTITGVALTTIGDSFGATIMPSSGESAQTTKAEIQLPDNGVVKATYSVQIEGENPLEVNEYFELPVVRNILSSISPSSDASQQTQQASADMGMNMGGQNMGGGMPQQPQQQQPMGGGQFGGQQQQQPMGGGQFGGQVYGSQQQPANVQGVQFPSLSSGQGSTEAGNISLLMDVYMEMTVELGRTKKSIKEILGMGEGTIIELDKLAGEPVDILVNHKLIATGEVVVIDENFGVRVTEIVSPTERMKDLT